MNEALVVLVRGVIAFLTLLIMGRALGKQQISQFTLFHYIEGITIGSIAASLTVDTTTRPWPQFVGLTTWAGLVALTQLITLKWRGASKYIDGEPTVVIMNGQIMEETLRRMRFRVSDLLEELRLQTVFDIREVEFAVLEKDGRVSVLKKAQNQPLTPKDMNIPTQYKGIGAELIYDGVVVEANLAQVNLDRRWLDSELKKRGIKDPSEVFLAELNTQGDLYLDLYRDRLVNPTDMDDEESLSRPPAAGSENKNAKATYDANRADERILGPKRKDDRK